MCIRDRSGIAVGADVILLPEIPYDIDKVAEVVENRFAAGKKFSIIAVAEGAISKEDAKLKKKQYKAKLAERRYPSVAYEIAAALEEKTNREIRVTVPGHTQRGGCLLYTSSHICIYLILFHSFCPETVTATSYIPVTHIIYKFL